MRFLIAGLLLLGLSACQTIVSEDEQALSQLQQERARLNRVYAQTEATILQRQQSEVSAQAANKHFVELRQIRFKKCERPTSPQLKQRLQFTRCQYDATLEDLERLQMWQKINFQFPAR